MDGSRVAAVAGDGPPGGDRPGTGAVAAQGPAPPGYLGHRARLRRRLVEGGPGALLDHELLEMVLFHALPRRDTKPMAQALMRRFGGFAPAVSAPPAELGAVTGLGEAGAAALKAVQAAALRLARAEAGSEGLVLDDRDGLMAHLTAALAARRTERLRVLFFDRRGRLIAEEAQGGSASALPREVVRRALEVGATALVLVRNQPDGDPAPSQADAETAAAVEAAAAAFGIVLRDHLVVARGQCASLRREEAS